jgi:hypothetical protein
LVFVAACGARSGTPTPTPVPRAGSAPATAPPPNPSGPTEPDCDALLAHAIGLVVAERTPPPSDADAQALRAELRPAFLADCRAGTRAYHQCGLAAKSRADLDHCKRQ